MAVNMKAYEEHLAELEEFRKSDNDEQFARIALSTTGLGILAEVAGRQVRTHDDVVLVARARLEREPRVTTSYFLDNGDELHLFGTDPDGTIAYFVVVTDGDEVMAGIHYEDTLWEGWKEGRVVEHADPRPLVEVATRLNDLSY